MNFQLVKGGRCRLRQKPATARNHPTPSDGYQACTSNSKAMEGCPSRPAFPARRSFPRAPFPRIEPWLVRTLPFRTPVRALFPCPEPLPAPCSSVPKPCPCTDRSLRSLARALFRRSSAPNPCPCAVTPSLRSDPVPVPPSPRDPSTLSCLGHV